MRNFTLPSLSLGFGSESTDLNGLDLSENPLPPCPDSPNCIRISRSIQFATDITYDTCLSVLQQMNPEKITSNRDTFRIEAVFKVFLFWDDTTIQLTQVLSHNATQLHLKSTSRIGYNDLGVNRRRVAAFLEKLQQELTE